MLTVWMLAFALAGSYIYLLVVFVLQHLLSCTLVVLVFLLLVIPVTLLIRPGVRDTWRYLLDLPRWLALTSLAVVLLVGGLVFVVMPFEVPGLRAVPIPPLLERVAGFCAVAGATAFGLLRLLLKTIGTARPLVSRFIFVGAFLSAYLIVGLLIYDSYGLSVDERFQRNHSIVSLRYVFQQLDPALAERFFSNRVEDLHEYQFNYYPVSFHLPIVLIETLNRFDRDSRVVWLFRHLMTFLLFYGGVIAFYRLAYEKFKDWQLALIGAVMLVGTPHIFAQSFFNIKDAAFLAAFALTVYAGYRYWRKVTVGHAASFGAVVAFAANVRIVAVFLIVPIIALILFDVLRKAQPFRRAMLSLGIMLLTFGALFILLFPASWSDPLRFSLHALRTFSDYTLWDGSILYLGEWIPGQQVPWHYLPVWMAITIPVPYLALFAVGALSITGIALNHPIRLLFDDRREDVLFLLMFVAPILALIVMGSTLYTDWRHVYFLYIPFLLVALHGLRELAQAYARRPAYSVARRWLLAAFAGFGLALAGIFVWMAVNHPYQYVYRNPLIVDLFGGREAFDRDLLRSAASPGFEYIARSDSRDNIVILAVNGADASYISILPSDDRSRLHVTSALSDAVDYVINLYRMPGWQLVSDEFTFEPVHSITVDGLPILSIYRPHSR
ncbi:MAG: glycosyltransferase family 39 protein [Anaerolineae bacterium]|nr:glycosyltransferase family 39 protein [Anaerolineae bacterium]